MNFVRSFVNYAIFRELCERMRFEVDCAKSHHIRRPGLDIAKELNLHFSSMGERVASEIPASDIDPETYNVSHTNGKNGKILPTISKRRNKLDMR